MVIFLRPLASGSTYSGSPRSRRPAASLPRGSIDEASWIPAAESAAAIRAARPSYSFPPHWACISRWGPNYSFSVRPTSPNKANGEPSLRICTDPRQTPTAGHRRIWLLASRRPGWQGRPVPSDLPTLPEGQRDHHQPRRSGHLGRTLHQTGLQWFASRTSAPVQMLTWPGGRYPGRRLWGLSDALRGHSSNGFPNTATRQSSFLWTDVADGHIPRSIGAHRGQRGVEPADVEGGIGTRIGADVIAVIGVGRRKGHRSEPG